MFHHQKNDADKKAVADLKDLQRELERSADECKRLREKLAKTEAELQTTVEEWVHWLRQPQWIADPFLALDNINSTS